MPQWSQTAKSNHTVSALWASEDCGDPHPAISMQILELPLIVSPYTVNRHNNLLQWFMLITLSNHFLKCHYIFYDPYVTHHIFDSSLLPTLSLYGYFHHSLQNIIFWSSIMCKTHWSRFIKTKNYPKSIIIKSWNNNCELLLCFNVFLVPNTGGQ